MASIEPVHVCLDPGHGGLDMGAVANGITEKDYVLDFSRRQSDLIHRLPHTSAFKTRDSDVDPTLKNRGISSKKVGSDGVICLHINAHTDPELQGALAIYLPGDPLAEKLSRTFLESLPTEFLPKKRREPRAPLRADASVRWLKRSRNVLLPHSHAHPILLELGYATNPGDATLLKSAWGQTALHVACLSVVACLQRELHRKS